jgi:3-hydroxy-9,10-secoandrosta-1,3,5(10)-triene-9,17-dione monooxygenase
MTLVAEAKRLAPMLAANSGEDDQLRRLSDPTWKLLLDGGFLRALQPARFGGGEVSLVECSPSAQVGQFKAIEEERVFGSS